MADTYTSPQSIVTVPAGELGTTVPSTSQSINLGAGIQEMSKTISVNYCITSGTRALSVGPLTINSIVTVPNNASWVIK
jgi:hypothetical protein